MKVFDLEKSLLFRMSLGSKELYHSNVWAWLMENDNNFIRVFFNNKNLDNYEKVIIEREKHNRDIVIKLVGKDRREYLVIENKIKTLPTKDQLKKYTEDIDNYRLIGAVFTGLLNPFNEKLKFEYNNSFLTWDFLNYVEIANKIQQTVESSTKEEIIYYKDQIFEYCSNIKKMQELLLLDIEKTNDKLEFECSSKLKSLRIEDLFIKLKGAHFINYVRQNLEAKIEVDGYKLEILQGFHHGKATLDFRYVNWDSKNYNPHVIGVSIEGAQYRRYAQRSEEDQLFSKMCGLGWFDNTFDKNANRRVFGKTTKMKPTGDCKYNKYQKENQYFIAYQYYDIISENFGGLNYDKILKVIKQDIKKAEEIILSFSNNAPKVVH